jgi:glycine cleavage system H protein
MSTIYFSEEHEWILVEGGNGIVGITDYAQEQLGDIVFVEVSKVGEEVAKDDDVGVVESVKAASDIYCPVSGMITEANDVLDGTPEAVNADPMSGGWIFKITLSDVGELGGLMDRDIYKVFCDNL